MIKDGFESQNNLVMTFVIRFEKNQEARVLSLRPELHLRWQK